MPPRTATLPLALDALLRMTRFGDPEVLDVVDIPEPEAGPGQKLHDVSTVGVSFADTHHALS
jgi:NADPH:quinone reductase-like Zn-dependent oxidoreductase